MHNDQEILPLNVRKARVFVTVHDNGLAALSAGSACGKSGKRAYPAKSLKDICKCSASPCAFFVVMLHACSGAHCSDCSAFCVWYMCLLIGVYTLRTITPCLLLLWFDPHT